MQFSDFEKITVADVNESAGKKVVDWLQDRRVDFLRVDVNNGLETVSMMKNYDIVMDGTSISMNARSTECIAKSGAHGINLNGFGPEWDYDELFKQNERICIPGFGMTPGVTNMMAMHAANQMDTVETVRCSHGAFRPIAFSTAIAETTRIEYKADYPDRLVFEDGQMKHVPPFARPRKITLPEPYGTHEQYIIPHPEPVTLSKTLAEKGIRLVEARGTWPPKNMRLLKTLHEWGMLQNDTVKIDEVEIGVMDSIFAYCLQSPQGQETDLYGYALHVEIEGTRKGQKTVHTLTHTHPPSDGSVPDWAGLRAYTRNVGIPLSIGIQLIGQGRFNHTGVVAPEKAFDPQIVFSELEKRQIRIHEEIVLN